MKDCESVSFEELNDIKPQITAVYFPVKNFNLESIMRWLMDRKFTSDNFNESDGYYIFIQRDRYLYNSFELKKLEGEDIRIEIGTSRIYQDKYI